MRLIFFIIISLVLHFLCVQNLEFLSPTVEPGIPVRRVPVKVRIVEQPRPNKVANKAASQPSSKPKAPIASPASVEDSLPVAVAPRPYSDFFPQAGDAVLESTSGGGTGGKRMADYGMPALQAADEIRLNLDIPLVFRKFHAEGRALAKIEWRDSGLQLLYLDGDPHFRAVLYDLLKSKTQKFRELMKALGRDDLRIRLIFTVKQQPQARVWDDTNVELEKGTLKILRTRFVWQSMDGKLPQNGMPLPDSYAKRSEAYDRAHLQRLRESPAFISPLRNHELP